MHTRGRCVECPAVDLCEACDELSRHADMAHTVLRITRPDFVVSAAMSPMTQLERS